VDVRVVKNYALEAMYGWLTVDMPTLLARDDQFLTVAPDQTEEHPRQLIDRAHGEIFAADTDVLDLPVLESTIQRPFFIHEGRLEKGFASQEQELRRYTEHSTELKRRVRRRPRCLSQEQPSRNSL